MGNVMELLAVVQANFGKDYNETQVSVISKLIKSVPIEKAKQVAEDIILEEKFLPLPCVWNERINGNDSELAEKHWSRILYAIKNGPGTYGRVSFGARANAALESIGGWHELMMSSNADLKWKRKDFMETFARIPKTITKLKAPLYLSGENCMDDKVHVYELETWGIVNRYQLSNEAHEEQEQLEAKKQPVKQIEGGV